MSASDAQSRRVSVPLLFRHRNAFAEGAELSRQRGRCRLRTRKPEPPIGQQTHPSSLFLDTRTQARSGSSRTFSVAESRKKRLERIREMLSENGLGRGDVLRPARLIKGPMLLLGLLVSHHPPIGAQIAFHIAAQDIDH